MQSLRTPDGMVVASMVSSEENELLIPFTVTYIPIRNIIKNKIIILYNRFIVKLFCK